MFAFNIFIVGITMAYQIPRLFIDDISNIDVNDDHETKHDLKMKLQNQF